MPNHPDTKENQPKVLLIAQLRAFLASGESFDLLPIKHEHDVKTEVESLVESWAESSFLVHGRFMGTGRPRDRARAWGGSRARRGLALRPPTS